MIRIAWNKYPQVAQNSHAKNWLQNRADCGYAANTIKAYGRDLDDYLQFCCKVGVNPETADKHHIAAYVKDLTQRPTARGKQGLANKSIQRILVVVRLYYTLLVEEGVCQISPISTERYQKRRGFGGQRARQLIPAFEKLPWIPTEAEWQKILTASKQEPLRNRLMLALHYDAALRREELCLLDKSDIDFTHCLIRIRAEIAKNNRERIVPFSKPTAKLLFAYLQQCHQSSTNQGPLFLSESRRNKGQQISFWTWTKTVEKIAAAAGVEQFTTHTLRHLRLTDLARSGFELHEIAVYAGHKDIKSTTLYIHLSGREVAAAVQKSLKGIHAWRSRLLGEG